MSYLIVETPEKIKNKLFALRNALRITEVLRAVWPEAFVSTECPCAVQLDDETDIVTLVNSEGVQKELSIDVSRIVIHEMTKKTLLRHESTPTGVSSIKERFMSIGKNTPQFNSFYSGKLGVPFVKEDKD